MITSMRTSRRVRNIDYLLIDILTVKVWYYVLIGTGVANTWTLVSLVDPSTGFFARQE